jgi:hypothetical protein
MRDGMRRTMIRAVPARRQACARHARADVSPKTDRAWCCWKISAARARLARPVARRRGEVRAASTLVALHALRGPFLVQSCGTSARRGCRAVCPRELYVDGRLYRRLEEALSPLLGGSGRAYRAARLSCREYHAAGRGEARPARLPGRARGAPALRSRLAAPGRAPRRAPGSGRDARYYRATPWTATPCAARRARNAKIVGIFVVVQARRQAALPVSFRVSGMERDLAHPRWRRSPLVRHQHSATARRAAAFR